MKKFAFAVLTVVLVASVGVFGMLSLFAKPGVADMGGTGVVGAADSALNAGSSITADEIMEKISEIRSLDPPANARAVTTAEEFVAMTATGTYYLANDITLTRSYDASHFEGTLYGNGKTVTTTVPLFDYLDGAVVRDLVIEGAVAGTGKMGALAKQAINPTLHNVVNYASVSCTDGKSATGGLIGLIDGSAFVNMTYCVNYGDVYCVNPDTPSDKKTDNSYNAPAGGLVGQAYGNGTNGVATLNYCVNAGQITGLNRLGGLFGIMGSATATCFATVNVDHCLNSGNVNSYRYSAGFFSRLDALAGTFTNSVNAGNVTTTQYVAGFVGLMECEGITASFENCLNEGNVSSSGDHASGFADCITGAVARVTATNCTNAGNITGTQSAGIFSRAQSVEVEVRGCLNEGTIKATGSSSSAGGIIAYTGTGCLEPVIENCRNIGEVSSPGSAGGIVGSVGGAAGGNALISGCINEGTLSSTSSAEKFGTAGILARAGVGTVTVTNCVNAENAVLTGVLVGGIVGYGQETLYVTYCQNDADISGTTAYGVAGIVADAQADLTIDHCINNGDIANPSNDTAGMVGELFVAGSTATANITYCENYGAITSNDRAGGMVGQQLGNGTLNVSDCINGGAITGKKAAGMVSVSSAGSTVSITDCTNTVDGVISGDNGAGIMSYSHTNVTTPTTISVSSCVNHATVNGGSCAGIVSYAYGSTTLTIEDCSNTANITGSNCAGIYAYAATTAEADLELQLTIRRCTNSGTITGSSRPGGIVGVIEPGSNVTTVYKPVVVLEGCVNTGDVTSTGNYAGGIASRIDNSADSSLSVTDCANHGDVYSTRQYVGGILAYLPKAGSVTFERCINTGDITLGAYDGQNNRSGGIVGNSDNAVIFNQCVNTGDIISQSSAPGNDSLAGGIVGCVNKLATYNYCVNTGSVTGGQRVGGITGHGGTTGTTFTGCVNTGSVYGDGQTSLVSHSTGGIAGYVNGTAKVYYCVVTGDISADYPDTSARDYELVVSAFVGYANGSDTAFKYNYFAGTLDAGEHGFEVLLANYRDNKPKAGNVVCNYSNTASALPLYHGKIDDSYQLSSTELSEPILYNINTLNFLNALNANDGLEDADAFVMAKACNGTNLLPIYYETLTAFQNSCDHSFTIKKFNENTHWTECACGAVELGSETEHNHTVKYNANGHWNACADCGWVETVGDGTPVMAAHDGTATCQSQATCSVCGYKRGDLDANNHEDTEMVIVYIGNGQHQLTYVCCGGAAYDAENCYGGDEYADCAHGKICEVCFEEYTDPTGEHSFDLENGTWYVDDANDKHYLRCTVEGCTARHEVDCASETAATCTNKATCDTCGQRFGALGEHQFATGNAWTHDDENDTHYHACTADENCTVRADEVACHSATSVADCVNYAVCDVCGNEFGALSTEHQFDETEWIFDAVKNKHYYACTVAGCTARGSEAACSGGEATCTDKAMCEVCENAYGDVDENNHASTAFTYVVNGADSTKHDKRHACCEALAATEAHSGGKATCTRKATCAFCGTKYGAFDSTVHNYTNGCDTDCDACGAMRSPEAHDFGDWTVTKQATATEEGKQERTCAVCGGVSTATIPVLVEGMNGAGTADEDSSAVSTDDIIGIVVVGVAAVLVLGLITAFIVHKRRKAK